MCLFVSLFVNLQFVSYYFSALNIFSLNFARTLGHAVDKLLNGSRFNSYGQFIFGKPWVCFEATRLSNKTVGVIFHISRHGQNWAVLFLVKVDCSLWKSRVKYTFWTKWNILYAISTGHFRRREFFKIIIIFIS